MSAGSADDLLDQADQHFRANRLEQAAALLVRASELHPDDPRILRGLGIALVASHRAADALPALHRLAELRSNDPTTFHQLGDALAFARDLPAAAAALRQSVALKPDYAPAWARLGNVLRAQQNNAGAIDAFEHAAQLEPNPDVLSNLADALIAEGRPDEAARHLLAALRINPSHLLSHVNLSCAYMRLGQVDQAIDEIRAALQLRPDFAPARHYLALALLKRGEFAEGWPAYENRFAIPVGDPAERIDRTFPRWRGEDLRGRKILLHTEQGFGDAIQFARYIPLIVERARAEGNAHVIVSCHRSLWRLFQSIEGVAQLVDLPSGLPPDIDLQCPFMSMPLAFGTRIETIPAKVPYLAPPAELVAKWKQELSIYGGLRVGVLWSGKASNSLDHYRSCRLDDLAPLWSVRNVAFFSLQKDDPGEQYLHSKMSDRIIDLTAQLSDWAETAALMMGLDLIISVDSAPVHLAGALGRPTWALLSRGADWRWHVDRDDSPWYPTMRLFRQSEVNRWDDVMQRVAAALSAIH
jgi:tetratricopeptide (TPR) repeat protein